MPRPSPKSPDTQRPTSPRAGQQKLEMFASSPRDFFAKAVEAQMTFEVDDRGRATALVLHQNGREPRAKRVE